MFRIAALTAIGAAALVGGTQAAGQENVPAQTTSSSTVAPPKRITKYERFHPDRTASGGEFVRMARIEQDIWGGPNVVGRLACESGLRSWATNGTYHGAGQIGPWWWYAYPQTPRQIRYDRVKFRKLPILRRTRDLTTGLVTEERIGTRRQRVRIIYTGWLPRGADQFHAWANVRVTHRAASGDGPSTGWACSL